MVVFITYSRIPAGDALAIRSVNIARIFREHGCDVLLLGMGDSVYDQPQVHEGLSYVSLRFPGRAHFIKLKNYFGFKKRIKHRLDSITNIEAVVLNSLPLNALLYVKKLCRKRKIQLLIDCCEWYSPEQFRMGKLNIQYLLNWYYVTKYIDTSTCPIAISKYLLTYFNSKKCNAVRIPAIMDVTNISFNKRNAAPSKIVLMYAGSVGRKDYLDVMLNGLLLLNREDLAKIEFRVFGATVANIKDHLKVELTDELCASLRCYGRVSREQVLKNLEEADFTVLIRSATQRYAKAGFPTKVVESLAAGTPVICNLTSDLADYITDGINGIAVNGETPEEFSIAVKKATKLSVREKQTMSQNARSTAENHFDYRLYKDQIAELLEIK
ncbi:MAG: glycosyltransferase [Planctomycetaceae bacterium]|nr:glycosyltransferase [Planctomycetaceae bacterium]